jgi:tight adherence protein C
MQPGILKPLALTLCFVFSSAVAYQLLPDFRRRATLARLGRAAGKEPIRSPMLRFLKPFISSHARWFRSWKLVGYRSRKEKDLVAAGLKAFLSVDELLAWKTMFALLFPFLIAVAFPSARHPLVLVILVALFSALPDFFLKDMANRRKRQILRDLPFSIDLLTLIVEAGLDFSAGLRRVLDRLRPGPLRDELAILLRDIRLGTSRAEALRALANRCDIVQVSSFAAVLIQADQLGASIGPVLRVQSDQMRTERFQTAEKKGAQAATKILFPLVLFIMPATFIIILGPIILRFIYGLG